MKSLITGGILIASLVLAGNVAMAATSNVHKKVAHISHPGVATHVVTRGASSRAPSAPSSFNLGQFIQFMLGGPLPPQYAQIVRNAVRQSAAHGSSRSFDYSPSYDNSPPMDESSAARDAQAASDAENQAIQQMNDTNALNASMAAAEEQNDAANAATLQTEINAGM